MKTRRSFRSAAPLALPLVFLGACHIHLGEGSFVVDGRHLAEEHEETLELDAWPATGIVIEVPVGDVHVEAAEGPIRVRADVHETVPADGRMEVRDGKLVAVSQSGEPVALSDVRVWTPVPLARLRVATGTGDVHVTGVDLGAVELSTGAGDLVLRSAGSPESVHVSTGIGDVRLGSFTTGRLEASTGLGDVSLKGVHGESGDVSTGLGDVSVEDSRFPGGLDADTGMGDVDVSQSQLGGGRSQSGLGRVRVVTETSGEVE